MRILFYFLGFFCWFSHYVSAQSLPEVPEGKASVYFVRNTSLGWIIQFTYFDGNRTIGRFNGPKYLRYVCEPGEHLFWVQAENREYIEAELEAGKNYFVNVRVQVGALSAGVDLIPINPEAYKMDKILKFVRKKKSRVFTEEDLISLQQEKLGEIKAGLERYEEVKFNDKKVKPLRRDMYLKLQ